MLGFEQAHVLDGDHRLVGKGGQKLDLLVVERPYVAAHQGDHTDRRPLTHERNAEQGTKVAQFPGIRPGIFGVIFHIGDLGDFAFEQGPSGDRSSLELNRNILDIIGKFTGEAVGSGAIEELPLLPGDGATVGLAEPRCGFDQRVQNRLQIERGAADDLEHVSGRGLLFQRLAQLARPRLLGLEQPHVLDRDHRLVGKGGDQLNLLVGEGFDFGAA